MKTLVLFGINIALVVSLCFPVFAQEPSAVEVKDPSEFTNTVFSGPQPGEVLPPLRVTGLGGELDGEEFDAVALAKGAPHILFIQDTSPVGFKGHPGLAFLLNSVSEKSPLGLIRTIILLDDDPTKASETRGLFGGGDIAGTVMGLSLDGRDGPGTYGLNRQVAQTIIVAKEGKVLYNFAFAQPLLYPDPHVLGAIAEAIGQDRTEVATWLTESRDSKNRPTGKSMSEKTKQEELRAKGMSDEEIKEYLSEQSDETKMKKDKAQSK